MLHKARHCSELWGGPEEAEADLMSWHQHLSGADTLDSVEGAAIRTLVDLIKLAAPTSREA